ncbi:MAG: mechanosensitive ion channel family protein [Halobacteriota archaeon]
MTAPPGPATLARLGPEGSPALPAVVDPLYDLLDFLPASAVDAIVAVAVVILSWVLGRALVRFAGRPVARRFERPSVTRAVLQVIRASVVAVGLMIAGALVGFSPGEILLSVTVFSAVLAVVLAPVVRRFIGGMFVLADQPYEIGDMIEIVDTGMRGFVEDVTLRYTKLFTLDNTFIVVPNSNILERDIVNYSAEDKRTRQEVDIVVTYEGELTAARRRIEAVTAEVDGVIGGGPAIRIGSTRYPAEPVCLINAFGDHGVHLRLRYWIRDPFVLFRVRSDVLEAVFAAVEDTEVEIAYPHSHLVFDETSGELDVALLGDGP